MYYMTDTVGIRELRQNASAVLRDVKAGHQLTLTEHGRPIARLLPYEHSELENLIANGQARMPIADFSTYELPSAKEGQKSTADILAEIRGSKWR